MSAAGRILKMLNAGISSMQAQVIGGGLDNQQGVVAAGTTQATATTVSGDIVNVTTTPASSGVVLGGAAFTPGDSVVVYNGGANALLIYPPSGCNINALATNAGYSLAAGTAAHIVCMSSTQFATI